MKEYLNLVSQVLENGTKKTNRTGTDTLMIFGYHYKINLIGIRGYLMDTEKWKSVVVPLDIYKAMKKVSIIEHRELIIFSNHIKTSTFSSCFYMLSKSISISQ